MRPLCFQSLAKSDPLRSGCEVSVTNGILRSAKTGPEIRSLPSAKIGRYFALRQKPGNAGWSSPVARQAHNLKAAGSNPAPATKQKSPRCKNARGLSTFRDLGGLSLPPSDIQTRPSGRERPSSGGAVHCCLSEPDGKRLSGGNAACRSRRQRECAAD